jgi:hypothetical protein
VESCALQLAPRQRRIETSAKRAMINLNVFTFGSQGVRCMVD